MSSSEIAQDAIVQNGGNNATGSGGYRVDSCVIKCRQTYTTVFIQSLHLKTHPAHIKSPL